MSILTKEFKKEDIDAIINEYKKKLSYEKSDDTKTGFKDRAKEGLFNGSTAPYGYYSENGNLYIKNDYTPYIVKRIFEEYISGKGFDGIAKGLYDDNIPTPRENSCKWHGSSIRTILENPHYTGDLVQSRTEVLYPAKTERIIKDESDYIIIENSHEAIISKEDFNLVKSMIQQRKRTKPSTQKHLFSNIIFCKECGRSMNYKKHMDAYLCGSYIKHGKKGCEHNKKIKMGDLKDFISSNSNLSQEEITSTSINKLIERIDISEENDIIIKYRSL
ncbi:MAG: recombinase family protein [Clostridium sp.]|nr:recombinase family protein [Clostridium sp.]MBQ8999686.1 recombinase family protein [Clostridium sp.]